jgi:hypothetical protein
VVEAQVPDATQVGKRNSKEQAERMQGPIPCRAENAHEGPDGRNHERCGEKAARLVMGTAGPAQTGPYPIEQESEQQPGDRGDKPEEI